MSYLTYGTSLTRLETKTESEESGRMFSEPTYFRHGSDLLDPGKISHVITKNYWGQYLTRNTYSS